MQTLKSKIWDKRIEIIFILLILIIGLISITWFRGNYLIKGGDSFVTLSPSFALKESSQVWAPWATGVPFPLNVLGFFFNLQMIFLESLGISLVTQQKILYYVFFTIGGLGMYALFSTLVTGENKQIGSLGAALFYMMNPYALSVIWGRQTGAFLTYGLMPVFLALFIKGLFSKKGYFEYLFSILTIWLLVPISMSNPGFWLPIWMVLFSFLFFFVAINRDNKTVILYALRFFGLLVLFWLFLNLWWILPLSFMVRDVYGTVVLSGEPASIFQWTSLTAVLVNSLRLLGDWTIYAKYGPDPYFSWASIYFTPFFILISFIPPLLALGSPFFKSMRKYVLFFAALAIVGLFLIKGPQAPLGWLNTLWFKILPFSEAFRSTYEKLGIVVALSYAFLIGVTISGIFGYLRSRLKNVRIKFFKPMPVLFLILIFTILYCVLAFPFWTGEIIWAGGSVRPSLRIQVPEYYYEAAEWFEKQGKNFRILYLPSLPEGGVAYNWEYGYFGSDPLDQYFFNAGMIGVSLTGNSAVDEIQRQIKNSLSKNNNTPQIGKLLALVNIKHILLHNDFNLEYTHATPLKHLQSILSILNSQKEIHFEKSFRKLDFYKISDEYFLPHIYPASGNATIVTGNTNSLIPLTYTPYLDGYPALVFTEQQNRNSLISLVGSPSTGSGHSQQSAVNNQVLFSNSNFGDFVIDLAKAEAQPDSRQHFDKLRTQSTVGSQMPILVKLDNEGKGNFRVKDNGLYDVYIRSLNLKAPHGIDLKIQVDEEDLENGSWEEGNKWIKIDEVNLDKGKHRITVSSQKSTFSSYIKKELEKLFQSIEIVIVSKEKQKEYEDLLKSKDIGYLFYVDKEKVENMLKNKEKLEDIKLKGNNPFRIGKQQFYIPEDGNYSIKAMTKPKRVFLEKDFVSSSNSISIKSSLDAISNWDIKALKTTYKQNLLDDGMHVDVYFGRRKEVKEGVILSKKFSGINIKERPYLAFSCEMEDTGVQEMEMDIMIKILDSTKTKKMTLKADNKQFIINLYEKALRKWLKGKGEKKEGNLFVDEVVLRFKKKDGVDLFDERKRQIYPFIFKNIAFLKAPPILALFEDKLSQYLPENYYYFNRGGELKSVDFPEQIPLDIKDVYKLHIQRFIDLKEIPLLSLSFPRPVWGAGGWRLEAEGRDGFPSEWKVILGIDFDGDEKEDSRIVAFVPASGLVDGKLLLTVRAYEEVKKQLAVSSQQSAVSKKHYNLLSIGISHPEDKEIVYQTVMSKKLIRYREHIQKPLEVRGERQEVRGGRLEVRGERIEAKGERQEAIGAGVLEVDGKIYKLPSQAKGDRQKVKDEENNWVEFNNIRLEEGEHSLNVFENDKFKVEMVEIKPISSISSIGFISSKERQEPPKIEFKKINPTRYIVDVKGANGPFTLVFSESFHKEWKGYVRQSKVSSQQSRLSAIDWRLRANRGRPCGAHGKMGEKESRLKTILW